MVNAVIRPSIYGEYLDFSCEFPGPGRKCQLVVRELIDMPCFDHCRFALGWHTALGLIQEMLEHVTSQK